MVSIVKLRRRLGARAVRPLWMAGIAYVGGAVLEATGHPVLIHLWVGPHEVFHAAVVLGALLHWLFIRRVLLTYSPAIASPAVPSALGSFRVIAAHHLG